MDRNRFAHLITRACVVLAYTFVAPAFDRPGVAGQESETSQVSVRDRGSLKLARKAVIFLDGADTPALNILVDALAVELREIGWNVASRVEVESALQSGFEEVQKLLPDSVRSNPMKFDAWFGSLPQHRQEVITKSGDDAAVAGLVGADVYVVGTVVVGRQQYTSTEDEKTVSAEKVVVAAISVHIVSTSQKRPILEAVLGYVYGKGGPFVAKDIRAMIETNLRK